MNTYAKFAPTVFVAKCTEKYNKGDITTITNKYGNETEIEIHNLVKEQNGFFFYSFVRTDGLDTQERIKRKVERYRKAESSANERSYNWVEKSKEGDSFLSLGEPIKVGHHSEKKHRALIARNARRMDRAVEEMDNAKRFKEKADALERHADKIDLSMPASLEFFSSELEKAKAKHQDLKDNPEKRGHAFSLTYAKKTVNDLEKKVKLAQVLWG
ncbi:DUF3560 domain-containing protein [Pasteurella multocida]|uniref:DUF3560 domain-containing protein n=1 Tax=Pasteurella multocida TaxID=747 RepID=UPI002341C7F9|nr:DUF3560 domain-containing protein [Pasteurella multocida]MDC4238451.1 DUF3560 domain-containing protein [Pasteurella multocida]